MHVASMLTRGQVAQTVTMRLGSSLVLALLLACTPVTAVGCLGTESGNPLSDAGVGGRDSSTGADASGGSDAGAHDAGGGDEDAARPDAGMCIMDASAEECPDGGDASAECLCLAISDASVSD